MRFIYSVCVAVMVILSSSCSYRQNQLLFEKRSNTVQTQAPVVALTPYRVQPRDVLQIRNLQSIKYITDAPTSPGASSSGQTSPGESFEVDDEGAVALPELGHVAVAGLTRMEATRKIEDLYRKNLLQKPIIDIKITNLKVTVLGEVASQGNFPLVRDNTTLVELIGQAGGLGENANQSNIKIIRGTEQNKTVTEIDLSDISSINDPRAVLQNGDIIFVAKNRQGIRQEKLSSFNSIIQPALILLNTALIIYTLSTR